MDEIQKVRTEIKDALKEEMKGVWVVAVKDTQRFLAKLKDFDSKEALLTSHHRYIVLNPVIELVIQIQQTPEGQISKVPIPMSVGMLAHSVDMRIDSPTLVFFEDMHEEDRKLHEDLAMEGLKSMASSKLGVADLSGPRIALPGQVNAHNHGRPRGR